MKNSIKMSAIQQETLKALHTNAHALLTMAQAPALQYHIDMLQPFMPQSHVVETLIQLNNQLPTPVDLRPFPKQTLKDWLNIAQTLAEAFCQQILQHQQITHTHIDINTLIDIKGTNTTLQAITLAPLRQLCKTPPKKNAILNNVDWLYVSIVGSALTGAIAAPQYHNELGQSAILSMAVLASTQIIALLGFLFVKEKINPISLPLHLLNDQNWQQITQPSQNNHTQAIKAWLISHIATMTPEQQTLFTQLTPSLTAELLNTIDTQKLDPNPTYLKLQQLQQLQLTQQQQIQQLTLTNNNQVQAQIPVDI